MQLDKEHSLLVSDIDTSTQEVFDIDEYRIAYFIQKNKSKNTNEDVLYGLKTDDGFVLGVSDGAGGHPRGRDAAYIAGQQVSMAHGFFEKEPNNALALLEKINEKVLELKVGARCTLAMVAVRDNKLRAYSVGDSEIIHWNSSGAKLYSNIPHSTVGHRIEAGVLEQEQSLDEPDRYIVTNMMGDRSIRVEATSPLELKKGHTVIIGSDGLFDNIPHDTLSGLLAGGVFEKSFESLVQICKEQDEKQWKKDDDIAFIMFRKIKS